MRLNMCRGERRTRAPGKRLAATAANVDHDWGRTDRGRAMKTTWTIGVCIFLATLSPVSGQTLDRQKLLETQTFWDNRDWDWYKANIPFFECPDADITTTWYYRWEVVTKHLTYGSPNTGYTFTEFIDRPFWSGAYGAISCPAGHQLYEVRWLRDPRFARDYARYWFRTPGAQPRRYSTWLADAIRASSLVHRDVGSDLLPDLVKNYEAWEKDYFVPEVGLFWQTGHDDGMEININSRQTKDTVRGAPGYRPTLNAYMYADAMAISRLAKAAGDDKLAQKYWLKACNLKQNLQNKLWDPKREFFFHMAMRDETRDGHTVKAGSLTYQTGKYAGSPHGREQIGYVPWQFNLPDKGYEAAWKFLMRPEYFYASFGPTTVERRDPQFQISKTCCVWSGQSWPYATTQTLKALANVLQNYKQDFVTKDDYFKLLQIYARTHRKGGKPYIAEACDPDTGSWEGHDSYNHSEHYFHSGFCDLVITGLVGLRLRDDGAIELTPLAPQSWDWFALEGVPSRRGPLSVIWDKHGTRYRHGRGLHVLLGDEKLVAEAKYGPIVVPARTASAARVTDATCVVNFAVNNDGHYFPRLNASYTAPGTSTAKVIDGNYWYHEHPPNRWTCAGSPNSSDWLTVDFGVARKIQSVKLYFLDDGKNILAPKHVSLEWWDGKNWREPANAKRKPDTIVGRRANVWEFPEIETTKLRVTLVHADQGKTGLTEFEAWGPAQSPVTPAAPPPGNLAFNPGNRPFPRVTASHTSRFDKVAMANDGVVSFSPSPHNRWTSYESKNASDWLEVDFGEAKRVGRIELAIYDDRGGVQAPKEYAIEFWNGKEWKPVEKIAKMPERPAGGQFNEARFSSVQTSKIRIVFVHNGKARSGVSEIYIWPD